MTTIDIVKDDGYNDIVTTVLTDSSGNRDEAKLIIEDRLDLKQAIIDCTKERSSSLSTGLFKIMTQIPGVYYSDQYYLEEFLNNFFPVTQEDFNARKYHTNKILELLKPRFDRIRIQYITRNYCQLMDEVSSYSHVFLMISMDPTIIDSDNVHMPSLFLQSIFTHRVVVDNGSVNDFTRPRLPGQKWYPLISTLYKIVKDLPSFVLLRSGSIFKSRKHPVAMTDNVDQWLHDNGPPATYVKSAGKLE